MSPNKRRAVGVVMLALGALALAVRLTRPRHVSLPARPLRSDATYVHPIVAPTAPAPAPREP
jgi:hypothetical protein